MHALMRRQGWEVGRDQPKSRCRNGQGAGPHVRRHEHLSAVVNVRLSVLVGHRLAFRFRPGVSKALTPRRGLLSTP